MADKKECPTCEGEGECLFCQGDFRVVLVSYQQLFAADDCPYGCDEESNFTECGGAGVVEDLDPEDEDSL